jgi:cation:H+ antiporter
VGSLATPLLVIVFAAAAGVTWIAGVALSKTTDALDVRLGFGEELGGIILLAVAGSLPELAITISAASSGHLGLAAGNLIGGIAVQTMVLVVCDAVAGPRNSLTFLAGALTPVLEALLVVLVVSGVLMGALLRPSIAIGGVVSPASLAIVAVWVTGVYVIDRARKEKRWTVTMPGSRRGRLSHREPMPAKPHPYAGSSTVRVAAIFGAACAITLAAGVALEVTATRSPTAPGSTASSSARRCWQRPRLCPRSAPASLPFASATTRSRSGTSSVATRFRSASSWSPI